MEHTLAFRSMDPPAGAQPEGPAGPQAENHGLRGWMQGYGSWVDHEGSQSFSGFNQSIYGTVVGIDKAVGNVLLGVAGGYSQSSLNQNNHDSSDAWTRYGILYATFVGEDWFGDVNLSYGLSRIKTRSGTVFDAQGKADAQNGSLYISGGKNIRLSSFVFSPEAALYIDYFDQDGYSDGYKDIDGYDRWSYQSRFGAALSLQKDVGSVSIRPEVHAYWLHEFNADSDYIGYSLTGGTDLYTYGMQSPDEDVLEVGVGINTMFTDRLELLLGVDGQYSDRYDAIRASGRISFKF
jgi:outer membrane autotransporter protein